MKEPIIEKIKERKIKDDEYDSSTADGPIMTQAYWKELQKKRKIKK